jgi:hypothetical protein
MFSNLKARMTYANVASTIALVIVVGGGGAAVAASLVPHNSVGTKQIINGAVRPADLHSNAVTGAKIHKGAINSPRVFGTANLGIVRAYAWNSSPSADANLTHNGYTYNRSGRAVTVTHDSTGIYTINFAGLNLNGGNIVVSGYGSDASWCKVGGWGSSSVSVYCFDAAGAAVDSYWTIAATD